MSNKAFIFPGQGAQYVGMGKDFYDQFSVAKDTFDEADEILKQKLSTIIFEGPENQLVLTKNAQMAIFVVSVAIWRTVMQQFPALKEQVCAGLSLGEYTALTVAGKLSFEEALLLVQARASFMQDDCIQHPGVMHVILGLDAEVVEQEVAPMSASDLVWVANINCPGQVVISGSKSGVEKASEKLKARGAKRSLPLDVSGAFHSGLMENARQRLKPYIAAAKYTESDTRVVMNVPGDFVEDINAVKNFLIDQVTHPVRWEKGVRSMAQQGIDLYIEMGPGKTLAGMNKRIGVSGTTISVEKVSDLELLQEVNYATTER
jgi:[acyl-carrier-protein] S-malonyltransferase